MFHSDLPHSILISYTILPDFLTGGVSALILQKKTLIVETLFSSGVLVPMVLLYANRLQSLWIACTGWNPSIPFALMNWRVLVGIDGLLVFITMVAVVHWHCCYCHCSPSD